MRASVVNNAPINGAQDTKALAAIYENRASAEFDLGFNAQAIADAALSEKAYPNAAALAMAPFDRNIGSASAMLGFLQIGVSGIASAAIGVFDSHTMMPVTLILAATSWIGVAILMIGKRRMAPLRFVEEQGATPLVH